MSSVSVRKRTTGKGHVRFDVRYREGGRGTQPKHGGTFGTRDEADHRAALIRTQLASGAPVRFTNTPAPIAYRWIYFIRMGIDGPVKIGSAVNPEKRLGQLQTANPYRLTLMAKVPWIAGEEQRLHEAFRHAQMVGEWFRPEPELIAHIASLTGELYEAPWSAHSRPGAAGVLHAVDGEVA